MSTETKILFVFYFLAILFGVCCFELGWKMGIEKGKSQIIQTIMNATPEGE